MDLEASHSFSSSMASSSQTSDMCQCFAVLEDGVLAHNLQEQEIEKYYTTNIQKNKLVQNDIRVAKRLQDEEEEQRMHQSATLRQASRQLEAQDFEYARLIQDEIQRCAQETHRRELYDEEIAKRLQEEEKQRVRSSSRGQECHSEGASQQPDPDEASLDLGELQQVLRDEELARKLQEEEKKLSRRFSHPSPRSSQPAGDFRVAQVAQDEEIARFMQKQEIKSKRRSRELEGPESWREHRAMMSHHNRRAAKDRQVQRERLDSEGLPSPTEDCSPETLPPSPISTLPPTQQVRNIAEELDPTFQARRHDTGSVNRTSLAQSETRQTMAGHADPFPFDAGPTCQPLPVSQPGLRDFLEEPHFIPPTKRQTDKSGRTKPKEKRENCKQQ
ncbi:coiled-coil domain-containing protein 187 isoform X4 [Labrus mixtus]|uniref:coiled-coil domain-containing protein 187 isoform X4 n=1 Tax=Labrus mixtus TaxID=508554 RepID=UPI0029C0E563|nr:coiled-coil domain-containing protein 187 isoform X4 [Labrus mixtus]